MKEQIYFPNFMGDKHLYLFDVYVEYNGTPIVFVCIDESNNLYMCLCNDALYEYSCMVIKATTEQIRAVLQNTVPILSVFEKSTEPIVLVGYNNNRYSYQNKNFKEIPVEDLPNADEYLDLSDSEQLQFLNNLHELIK